jgi:tetratricopeptide (TPR) repeat protein
MIQKLLLLSIFCLLSVPAFATEADFEKRMARGVTALDGGDAPRAQEEFRAALAEHPTDPEAALYLAIALNRAGDPSAESALKASLLQDPGNPRINFELGTLYYNRKMYDESGDYFENLQAYNPDPGIKSAADAYLANIRSRSGGKRWGITLMGGMQYDSNVPLATNGAQLPVGIDRRGDWRGVLNLGLNGVAYRDSNQELSGSYSLYQTLHIHLSEFDLTQNLLDVSYKRRVAPPLWAKISCGFESILLGGNQFVNGFTVTPGLLASFEEGMITALEYRFRNSTFKNSSLFPTNTERNGDTHSLILSHRQRMFENLTVRLAYTYERELTDVTAWSSISHHGSAGLAVSLSNTLLLDLSADATAKKYDAVQTGATSLRSDTTLTGAASITWQAFEKVGVSVGYYHTENSSNVSDYEYTRGITSILLQGRY